MIDVENVKYSRTRRWEIQGESSDQVKKSKKKKTTENNLSHTWVEIFLVTRELTEKKFDLCPRLPGFRVYT